MLQEEEGLEAKTTQRLALLRLGNTTSTSTSTSTSITIGNSTDHEAPAVFTDPYSACDTMKRRSPSSSSLQESTFDDEEPRNKKILVDAPTFSPTDNAAAAGALPENSTVISPPQQREQPQFQLSAHSFTRSVSGPVPFHFSVTPATTTQGQGTFLRRCHSDDVIAPPEDNDDFEFIRAPAAPPSIPASLVRSESLPSCELLPSFLGPSNTALTSPEATLPQRPPFLPRPAPASIQSTTQTKEKSGITALTEPKDSSRSLESGQTGVCGVALPESPAKKRLIRMKKRVEDMQKWLQEEEAEISAEDRAISTVVQNFSSSLQEEAVIQRSEREGGVTVATEGRGFGIHYCCNCGRRYQVQISLSDLMTVHLHENTERMP